MLVVFSLTTGEFVIAGLLPDVAADLSVPVAAAGLLVTAYAVGMIVGGPVVTALTARVARKPLIAGLVVVSVIGNLASVFAPGHTLVLVSRFVAGLVVATFFAVAIATAVAMAPAGREASSVAKVALGMNLGMVLGAPLGTLVGQQFGWRAAFAAVGALGLVALAMVLRFVPAQPAPGDGSVLGELRVFARRDVQLAIALTAVGNVGVVTVFVYIAPLLVDVAGFSSAAVPLLLMVYGVGAVIGNLLGGWLSDRALMPSLVGLLAALAAVLVLFWTLGTMPVPAAILTFVVGVLAFAIIPGMQTRVLTTAGAAPTLAVAVNASGFQVAAAFAGWFGGRIVESAWGVQSIPLAAALLTLVGLAIAVHSLQRDSRTSPAAVTAARAASPS